NWKILEDSYTDYIMDYARLAEKLQVEIFCIGTELDKFIQNRKSFWDGLIKQIKTAYSGKLTYAANWDEYKRVPFWNDLDLIGIDAYFPLSENKTPSVEDCREGWKKYKPDIEALADREGKPVLFTEFGYRSLDFAAREPWRSERSLLGVNHQAQINATQALFDEFWGEHWFAGGFVWKWFHDGSWIDPEENNRFSPQNKPAEAIIRTVYMQY
ncbi:MAG: glycoside hydrolase, partial [Flavobacteriaceae bacterium]|nr:glycoside hydrolase [Flavobacteriaceae bacterium]